LEIKVKNLRRGLNEEIAKQKEQRKKIKENRSYEIFDSMPYKFQ